MIIREAVSISETSINFIETTLRIPEDCYRQSRYRENLKYQNGLMFAGLVVYLLVRQTPSSQIRAHFLASLLMSPEHSIFKF
jgi:hypothetical protein